MIRLVYSRLPAASISESMYERISWDIPALSPPNINPRILSAVGLLFNVWIKINENFPSDRSSQKPFFAAYYVIVSRCYIDGLCSTKCNVESVWSRQSATLRTYLVRYQVLIIITYLVVSP